MSFGLDKDTREGIAVWEVIIRKKLKNMDRRHQVFVSSTYIDLVQERSEVMQALLELECMPAGMELFPAANDTQWSWIKKVIDESDYYIVIVAGRYGTVSRETGKSYTEMEYRYAVETGKPVIGFLYEDLSKLPVKFCDQSPGLRKKRDLFRQLVGEKLCKMYSSPADLGAKVSRSITQLKKQYVAPGWIRADVLDSLASADEFLELKKENEGLKKKIYQLGIQVPESVEYLASGKEKFEIEFSFSRNGINPETGRYRKLGESSASVSISWDDMFAKIGPDLLEAGERYWNFARALNPLIERCVYSQLERDYPDERFSDFRIHPGCVDTIAMQFRALKLIEINSENRWALTPYGDNYMTALLAIKKGKTKRE